mmetsp:Transcript_7512/g.21435  ORF Transcript_7512/g.21435 Transcript_7512/m.21435 type:complete len:489 (-) Transcript_7512:90-1556(-)
MTVGVPGGASAAAAAAAACAAALAALLALCAEPALGAYSGAAPIMLQFDRRSARGFAGVDAPQLGEQVKAGDTVLLRAHTGNLVKATGYGIVEATAAPHPEEAEFLTIELVKGDGPIMAGDTVFLKTWTGSRLSVTPLLAVVSKWANRGVWERFTIVKKDEDGPVEHGPIRFGDTVFLRAWTQTYIDADGLPRDSVSARFKELGEWQRLTVEKAPEKPEDPPATATPRSTLDGCACQQVWRYRGHRCTGYCCNPDQDPMGEWCFTDSSRSCSSRWGHCAPAPSTTTATTTTSSVAPETSAHAPVPEVSRPAWEHFELVKAIRRQGYTCPGNATANGTTFEPSTMDIVFDCRLATVALEHCKHMISYDYLDTESPLDGSTPSSRARELGVEALAESVAAYTFDADATLQLLLGSQEHCEVLMDPSYTTMGVGFATGGIYRRYWTQLFGASSPADVDRSCYLTAQASDAAAVSKELGVVGEAWAAQEGQQ